MVATTTSLNVPAMAFRWAAIRPYTVYQEGGLVTDRRSHASDNYPIEQPATEGATPATTTAPPIPATTTKGAQTTTATRTPSRIKNREHLATEPDGEM
jgi:hypothetical protein